MNENKALIRRWFEEVWNQKRVETIDELFAPEGRAYGMREDGAALQGPADWRAAHAAFCEAIPDIKIELCDVLTAGDYVTVRFTARGVHDGPFQGIPASHLPVKVDGISIARIHNGKIAEGWNAIDMLGLLQQIEAVPKIAEIAAAKVPEFSVVE